MVETTAADGTVTRTATDVDLDDVEKKLSEDNATALKTFFCQAFRKTNGRITSISSDF